MFKRLLLNNFRSIRESSLDFSEPINALIGANGSGKSNCVKALEFISTMHRNGIASALTESGLREGIAPKSIPASQIRTHPTYLEYEIILPRFKSNPAEDRDVSVRHSITFSWTGPRNYRIQSEQLLFNNPLVVGASVPSKTKTDTATIPDSFVSILRYGNKITAECNPPTDKSNINLYSNWLSGPFLPFLEGDEPRHDAFEDLLSGLYRDGLTTKISLVDPSSRSPIHLTPQLRMFKRLASSVRRFDMLLTELRQEQQSLDDATLSTTGEHLPSSWANLQKSHRYSARSITKTLRQIAPHIVDSKVKQLETGKEFIQFIEHNRGRPVESWNSSDGTLRALAILIAIESASPDDIIIIEEPEQNLHPWAIEPLIRHMQRVVEDKKCKQIFLPTHSPEVVRSLSPSSLFIANRNLDFGTEFISPCNNDNLSKLSSTELARLWAQGLIGGIPHA